jgi:dipeptidyl aminopeptidase/acylaminoacyl peptidase
MPRFLVALCLAASMCASAEVPYQKPPKEILDVLNAPATPTPTVNPSKTHILLMERRLAPPIAELAAPVHRIAGLRINPANNGQHSPMLTVTGLTMKKLDGGAETRLAVPPGARLGSPVWSPDGRQFAILNYTAASVDLYVGSTAAAVLRKVPVVKVNDSMPGGFRGGGGTLSWLAGSKQLLVKTVPVGRGAVPRKPAAPAGPNVQESSGQSGPVRTNQDMLTSPYDERLFEHYCTSQLAVVDAATLSVSPIGKPAIITSAQASPDGKHLLVSWVHQPYSYLHPYMSFPREVEVWDRAGKAVHKVHSAPLEDRIPIDGVATGPRGVDWRPTEGATLVWWEALDGGDPRRKVAFRDRLMMLRAPFNGAPVEVYKTQHRARGLIYGESGGLAFVSDYDRNRRWSQTVRIFLDDPSAQAKVLWSLNVQDRYRDPGSPLMKRLPNGESVLQQSGDNIFLAGEGASPKGDRPFLRRYNVATGETEEIFRAGEAGYEEVVALLAGDGSRFLTRYETPATPPNLYVRTKGSDTRTPLTSFQDPTPQLRGVKQQLVTYKRKDGVQLSFTLFLPPGYKEGERLPTILWAYPLEYNDADTAGQIGGSTQRYVTMRGASHLFMLLAGYAVLNNATIPIIGDPETVNKAVEMGVTDRARVGVSGHSYGAFMTGNLLAHTRLFKAGVARSGAYNRTLTPFGFQSERRTFWQARDTYIKMSPFTYADQIKDPLLLIHGEADNNQGTFPINSERLYHAVRGNGGTVRLTMLPFESHGYAGKESVEHAIWEMLTWFDKYVKNSKGAAARSGM